MAPRSRRISAKQTPIYVGAKQSVTNEHSTEAVRLIYMMATFVNRLVLSLDDIGNIKTALLISIKSKFETATASVH